MRLNLMTLGWSLVRAGDWMLNLFEFSAKQHKRNEKYQVWTHENHAEIIYSKEFILKRN